MKPESFCYWLQGFFELSKTKILTASQVTEIKEHLASVFGPIIRDRKDFNFNEFIKTAFPNRKRTVPRACNGVKPKRAEKFYCKKS